MLCFHIARLGSWKNLKITNQYLSHDDVLLIIRRGQLLGALQVHPRQHRQVLRARVEGGARLQRDAEKLQGSVSLPRRLARVQGSDSIEFWLEKRIEIPF